MVLCYRSYNTVALSSHCKAMASVEGRLSARRFPLRRASTDASALRLLLSTTVIF
jgi:hypothetical protein